MLTKGVAAFWFISLASETAAMLSYEQNSCYAPWLVTFWMWAKCSCEQAHTVLQIQYFRILNLGTNFLRCNDKFAS